MSRFFTSTLESYENESELERQMLEKKFKEKGGKPKGEVVPEGTLPSTFAEAVYNLDGKPFRLKNRDYLKPIYDWHIEDGLLMCGRQVEKSTTFSTIIANHTLSKPFYRGLYYAPANEQVKVFSEDRLGRLFKYSQDNVVERFYMDKHDKQNVFNKSFGVVGSLLYLRAAYGNGDNIRGISANGNFGDEIQDILASALPVIGETQAHAMDLGPGIRETWYAGTPKTFSNTIQAEWDKSNQSEWVVRCFGCGKDQVLGEKNITPDKYVCMFCGKHLTTENIAKNGRWVKMNPSSERYGFRISQLMSPSMSPKDVYRKLRNYPKGAFNNEVLGRSFEYASKPMPRYLLMRNVNTEKCMLSGRYSPYYISSPFFMGVDWGHGTSSFTIIVIGYFNEFGKFEVVYTRKFKEGMELEVNYQKNCIRELMTAFEIAYFIADYGDGFEQGQVFKSEYYDRFDMCIHSWNQKELFNYENNGFWVVNRNRCLYWYVDDVKKGRVEWPGADMEAIEHLLADHEVVQLEYRSNVTKSSEGNVVVRSSETMMYTHPGGAPDDSFQACFYAWFAGKIYMGMPIDPNSPREAAFGFAAATEGYAGSSVL